MLKLKQLDLHSWEFVHPDGYNDTHNAIDKGCDFLEMGNLGKAEQIFKQVAEEMPDNLDGIHHWALIKEKSNDIAKAKELWQKAVFMGRKAFPENFKIGEDLLLWGFLDNRPFLRCMHGLGSTLLKTGDIKQANVIFLEMLKLNPDDNQGARANAIETFFYLAQPKEALEICDQYPYDTAPDTLYGRALALFQLGDQGNANNALKQAIKSSRKVAKEIVKSVHKKPRSRYDGFITSGGSDEAYAYWKRNSIHWETCISSIDWVKAALQTKKKAKVSKEKGSVYQLKIKLKGVKPPVWRSFMVRGDITLYKLYIVLLEVMGWTGGHLHCFRINNKCYGKPDPDFDFAEETIDEEKVKLKDVAYDQKKKFILEYDFGDGWEHEITVEKILPSNQGIKYPVCLAGARACPPEDCGGPYGYANFLNAVSDPKHAEHESSLERMGGSFDPEEFNIEQVNKFLKDVEKGKPWFEGFV